MALREVQLDITYEGLCVPNAYLMDIVVDQKVIVEVRTVDRFIDAHLAQLNSYLYFAGIEVGLLFNFRIWPLKQDGFKRVINTRSNRCGMAGVLTAAASSRGRMDFRSKRRLNR